ncbi:putative Fe-Mo cluster-binding NifX family protein [Methanomicrobium sp. W14]|uniref:NifB/NifX family molybdenum-iron cluster-binding protein n=1 Tax=Methanomicrobium sp. W14 TaxID=2817839 RepID=UPI001AE26814|nr:NifB/NifX family molybdenum-iron cluster-binding protein [Methanomicrobium sp. W14]MBP2132626.1 putative Fe-Mo cluster-binding NifX family protein [Methanomicrobium sp. W14]
MKICITVKNGNMETAVEKNFGRTPYLAVYDTQTKKTEFIENTSSAMASGAGRKTAQAVIDSGAEYVITGMTGGNAVDALKAAGIHIIKAGPGATLKEAINDFEIKNSC